MLIYWSSIFLDFTIFQFQLRSDFHTTIAITIAIENHSGKISLRFSFQIRSAISESKSDRDFHSGIGPRLKSRFQQLSTVRAQNRDPFFVQKSDPDFHFKIDPRFSFCIRDPVFKS